jgi:hypothetical protein
MNAVRLFIPKELVLKLVYELGDFICQMCSGHASLPELDALPILGGFQGRYTNPQQKDS